MAKRDYYEILGVGKTADDEEIKRSYRKLAMQYHPDRNVGDAVAEERFKEAAEAYEVLRDPDKRQRYDRYGHAGLEGMGMPHFQDASAVFEMFGDLFGDFFGRRGGRNGQGAGRDLQVAVELDLVEAYRGVKKTLTFPRAEPCGECSGGGSRRGSKPAACRRCQGRGVLLQRLGFLPIQQQVACPDCGGRGARITDPCPACRGRGRVEQKRTLDVNIPAGVDTGTRVVCSGEGEAGPGGVPGDLYVNIRVREHPLFQREGQHLVCQVPITFSQAALGGDIEIPSLDGPIPHKIRRGTQYGDKVQLTGRGMPHPRGGRPGDLHVFFVVETPRNLTRRHEELFRELAELEKKHVSPQQKSFLDRLRNFFAAMTGEPPGAPPG
jgi:molecular chaperone DnaJ